MKFLALLTAALVLMPLALLAAGDTPATTDDGRKVILHEDGTWSFADVPKPAGKADDAKTRTKAENADLQYTSERKAFAMYLVPGQWEQAQDSINGFAEAEFAHAEGDAYALIVAERIELPMKALRNVAIANAKSAGKNFKLVSEESRTVNGSEVLCLTMNVEVEGIPFTYYGYYYVGPAGSIQLLTYTGQNLFEELKPDLESFLNGFVVLKKKSPENGQ